MGKQSEHSTAKWSCMEATNVQSQKLQPLMDPDEALADPLPHFLLSRVARVKAPVSLSNVVFSILTKNW